MKKEIYGLFFLLVLSCNFPKEPKKSWEQATTQQLEVGVSINPPFAFIENDSLQGIEIDWINDFATAYDLEVAFHTGTETELIKKLEENEYHVVLGGFKENSIWKKRVGMPVPYAEDYVFFIPKGENKLLWHLEEFIYENREK